MNERAIDSLARGASVQQARRDTLKALAAAALVAVAGAPMATEAKNNGNNGNNKNRKKRRNRGGAEQECPPEDCTQEAEQAVATTCQAQVSPCETAILANCGNNAECLRILGCCQFLGTCNSPSFFACISAPAPN
jgi:hypothetical protein